MRSGSFAKPLLAAVFLLIYQYFRNILEISLKKFGKFKIRLYICIVKQFQKTNKMTTAEKKQAIFK